MAKESNYKLIIFDFDGTLADTDEMIVRSMYYIYDKYNDGKRKSREEICYFSGPPIRETLKKELPHVDINLLMEEFKNKSISLYPTCMFMYENEMDVLKRLKEQGYILAVLTNKITKTTNYCLKLLDLDNIMNVVVGSSDVSNPKPYPEGIFKVMELSHVTDKNIVIYIGDNASDILTAVNAGVDSILVTWGPRKILEEVSPTYKANSYLELEEIINGKI